MISRDEHRIWVDSRICKTWAIISIPMQYRYGPEVVKITYHMTLNFQPLFIPLNQLAGAILDFGLRMADWMFDV
jgi:hypothetical protein